MEDVNSDSDSLCSNTVVVVGNGVFRCFSQETLNKIQTHTVTFRSGVNLKHRIILVNYVF
jgi:hypothetical protein